MSASVNPDIVTDGLVLCLDAGNSDCFRGESTTNLITSYFVDSYASYSSVIWSDEIDQYGNIRSLRKATINNVSGWTRVQIPSSIGIPVINQNYTISMWIKRLGSIEVRAGWEPEVGGADGYRRPEVESGYYGIAGGTQPNVVSDEWTYITYTFKYTSTTTSNIVLLFYINGNGGQIIFSDPQVEAKPYATQFVNGTRGSTVATGGGLADLSGNNNHGTIARAANPTAAFYNESNKGSLVLDGSNDYIEISNNDLYKFSNTQAFSINCWLQCTATVGIPVILAFATTSGGGYYFTIDIDVLRTNSFLFDYFNGSTFRGIQGNNNSIFINTWSMLTVTSSSNSVSDMKCYQNGIPVSYSTRGSANPTTIDYTNLPLRIGARGDGGYFKGNISQVSIYNQALTAKQIMDNYKALKGRYGL
jgi:hypothetical protein